MMHADAELELRNRQMMGKLLVICVVMLGFGFAMIPDLPPGLPGDRAQRPAYGGAL